MRRQPSSSAQVARVRLHVLARLTIVADDEGIVAGDRVANEAEAAAISSYRNFLPGGNHLRDQGRPINIG